MRTVLIFVFLVGILSLSAYAEDDACDMLFVQDARAMTFEEASRRISGYMGRWRRSA